MEQESACIRWGHCSSRTLEPIASLGFVRPLLIVLIGLGVKFGGKKLKLKGDSSRFDRGLQAEELKNKESNEQEESTSL